MSSKIIKVISLCAVINIFIISSCDTQKLPVKELSIERDGQVITIVKAEIAEKQEEKTKGLMHRKNLADGEGMLFIFEQDQIMSFWMVNTVIPLSIAFITSDGRIFDIKNMYPNDKNSVSSSRSGRYALEVPQGWFTNVGVKIGDIVNF
ncbi:MAG: DUF192 domain-containing protein [Treponema sp.]|nr:DUF192 domain-containing protein [Treponema sp.]MCL2250345.1 DUF192 domain-containing protein [Treponema sp.]